MITDFTFLRFLKNLKFFTLKMKYCKIYACILISCFSHFLSLAQNCKPDYSTLDKITKEQNDTWSSLLFSPNFGQRMMQNSNESIYASIIRSGNINKIAVVLIRTQEEKNASNVTQYKAVKGNVFYFGVMNGSSLKFITDEVSNTSDVYGSIGVNTYTLYSYIKDESLNALKDSLTAKPIDAVRILLEDGITIDQSVKEKEGNKMKQKSNCFFSFLEEKGFMK